MENQQSDFSVQKQFYTKEISETIKELQVIDTKLRHLLKTIERMSIHNQSMLENVQNQLKELEMYHG